MPSWRRRSAGAYLAVVPLAHASSVWLLMQGDWRGIAKHYVPSRTSTQVASHAQKYFLRQLNLQSRKRRSSLFDMAPDPDSVRPCPLLPGDFQQMSKVNSINHYGLLLMASLGPAGCSNQCGAVARAGGKAAGQWVGWDSSRVADQQL